MHEPSGMADCIGHAVYAIRDGNARWLFAKLPL